MLLCAGAAFADEGADRAAILKVLDAPRFTTDADGKWLLLRSMDARPHATPANEPLSGDYWPFWPFDGAEAETPATPRIRFVTSTVATVDCRRNGRALLVVLRKENGQWLIASVRHLRN